MDVAGVIIGLILAIAWAEAAAWLPALTRRIIRASAKRLEPGLRSRMEEEWLRYVQDMPGTLGPFLAGCQCLLASIKISPVRVGVNVRSLQPATKLRRSIRQRFQVRDLFVHDGKHLRRIRLQPKIQVAMFVVMIGLLSWSAYSAARLMAG